MPVKFQRGIAIASAIAALCSIAVGARAADPSALWNIVHGQCLPGERGHGDPSPCAKVDLSAGEAAGFAVLKDIRGATQFLLIPTRHISGIESRALLAPGATNYFAAAWEERNRVAWRLLSPMPRETLSLAINSAVGRTQNQLHIHIDCVRADVRDALRRARARIGRHWAPLPVLLVGHRYRAMRLDGEWLDDRNPFKLLAVASPVPLPTWVIIRWSWSACGTTTAGRASSSSTIAPILPTATSRAARTCRTTIARSGGDFGVVKKRTLTVTPFGAAGARSRAGSRWRSPRRRTG